MTAENAEKYKRDSRRIGKRTQVVTLGGAMKNYKCVDPDCKHLWESEGTPEKCPRCGSKQTVREVGNKANRN